MLELLFYLIEKGDTQKFIEGFYSQDSIGFLNTSQNRTRKGCTLLIWALIWAEKHNNNGIVEFLLTCKYDFCQKHLQLDFDLLDLNGLNAMGWIVKTKNTQALKLILEHQQTLPELKEGEVVEDFIKKWEISKNLDPNDFDTVKMAAHVLIFYASQKYKFPDELIYACLTILDRGIMGIDATKLSALAYAIMIKPFNENLLQNLLLIRPRVDVQNLGLPEGDLDLPRYMLNLIGKFERFERFFHNARLNEKRDSKEQKDLYEKESQFQANLEDFVSTFNTYFYPSLKHLKPDQRLKLTRFMFRAFDRLQPEQCISDFTSPGHKYFDDFFDDNLGAPNIHFENLTTSTTNNLCLALIHVRPEIAEYYCRRIQTVGTRNAKDLTPSQVTNAAYQGKNKNCAQRNLTPLQIVVLTLSKTTNGFKILKSLLASSADPIFTCSKTDSPLLLCGKGEYKNPAWFLLMLKTLLRNKLLEAVKTEKSEDMQSFCLKLNEHLSSLSQDKNSIQVDLSLFINLSAYALALKGLIPGAVLTQKINQLIEAISLQDVTITQDTKEKKETKDKKDTKDNKEQKEIFESTALDQLLKLSFEGEPITTKKIKNMTFKFDLRHFEKFGKCPSNIQFLSFSAQDLRSSFQSAQRENVSIVEILWRQSALVTQSFAKPESSLSSRLAIFGKQFKLSHRQFLESKQKYLKQFEDKSQQLLAYLTICENLLKNTTFDSKSGLKLQKDCPKKLKEYKEKIEKALTDAQRFYKIKHEAYETFNLKILGQPIVAGNIAASSGESKDNKDQKDSKETNELQKSLDAVRSYDAIRTLIDKDPSAAEKAIMALEDHAARLRFSHRMPVIIREPSSGKANDLENSHYQLEIVLEDGIGELYKTLKQSNDVRAAKEALAKEVQKQIEQKAQMEADNSDTKGNQENETRKDEKSKQDHPVYVEERTKLSKKMRKKEHKRNLRLDRTSQKTLRVSPNSQKSSSFSFRSLSLEASVPNAVETKSHMELKKDSELCESTQKRNSPSQTQEHRQRHRSDSGETNNKSHGIKTAESFHTILQKRCLKDTLEQWQELYDYQLPDMTVLQNDGAVQSSLETKERKEKRESIEYKDQKDQKEQKDQKDRKDLKDIKSVNDIKQNHEESQAHPQYKQLILADSLALLYKCADALELLKESATQSTHFFPPQMAAKFRNNLYHKFTIIQACRNTNLQACMALRQAIRTMAKQLLDYFIATSNKPQTDSEAEILNIISAPLFKGILEDTTETTIEQAIAQCREGQKELDDLNQLKGLCPDSTLSAAKAMTISVMGAAYAEVHDHGKPEDIQKVKRSTFGIRWRELRDLATEKRHRNVPKSKNGSATSSQATLLKPQTLQRMTSVERRTHFPALSNHIVASKAAGLTSTSRDNSSPTQALVANANTKLGMGASG